MPIAPDFSVDKMVSGFFCVDIFFSTDDCPTKKYQSWQIKKLNVKFESSMKILIYWLKLMKLTRGLFQVTAKLGIVSGSRLTREVLFFSVLRSKVDEEL